MKRTIAIPVPERLDERSVRRMTDALAGAVAAEAAVITIEGEADRFCLGMDFQQPDAAASRLALLAELLFALLQCPRPTLAIVDGPALGGGLGLACACDVILASERAIFGLPEALYGLAPAIIRPALQTRLSAQQLKMLLFTCHSRSAAEARALGLIDQLVSVEALDATRRQVIRQLSRANGRTVATCRRWDAVGLADAFAEGVRETTGALADPSVLEALREFTSEEALPWMH